MKQKIEQYAYNQVLNAVAIVAMAFAAGRRLLAQHSICFFAWYYLGISLAIHQEVWVRVLLKSRRFLLLAPRGHGKTELLGKIIPLWLIARDRNVRILMVSKADSGARKNAMTVRHELRENKRLIRDFGKFYDIKLSRIWEQTCFAVVRDKNLKDPTVEAIGLYGTITGGRFDYIIFDDPIDLDYVNTADQIQKVREQMTRTILPLLEPTGHAWAIGTRKAFNDIYGTWIESRRSWRYHIDKAIIEEPEDFEFIELDEPIIREDGTEQWFKVVIHGKPGKVLWKQHMPMEELLFLRDEYGHRAFNMEYQNIVTDDETALFKRADLEACRDESFSYVIGNISADRKKEYVAIFMGVDPSLVTKKEHAEKTDSDYMVIWTFGLTAKGRRDLIGFERARGLSPKKVMQKIEREARRLEPVRCVIEDNSFGVIYAENLIEDTDIPIKKHHTGADKNDPFEGVPALSARFETGKVRLPYATDEDRVKTNKVIDELHQFPLDEHDDIVMAAWIAEFAIIKHLKRQARQRQIDRQYDRSGKAGKDAA